MNTDSVNVVADYTARPTSSLSSAVNVTLREMLWWHRVLISIKMHATIHLISRLYLINNARIQINFYLLILFHYIIIIYCACLILIEMLVKSGLKSYIHTTQLPWPLTTTPLFFLFTAQPLFKIYNKYILLLKILVASWMHFNRRGWWMI